jgi:hypothetical protein
LFARQQGVAYYEAIEREFGMIDSDHFGRTLRREVATCVRASSLVRFGPLPMADCVKHLAFSV